MPDVLELTGDVESDSKICEYLNIVARYVVDALVSEIPTLSVDSRVKINFVVDSLFGTIGVSCRTFLSDKGVRVDRSLSKLSKSNNDTDSALSKLYLLVSKKLSFLDLHVVYVVGNGLVYNTAKKFVW